MTPHQLAATVRRAHAIGSRQENQIGVENYPREWQDMIVAALEAFGAAQAPTLPAKVSDDLLTVGARAAYELDWGTSNFDKIPKAQQDCWRRGLEASLKAMSASLVPSTQEKPVSFCSRCGGKDPGCYICAFFPPTNQRGGK